MTSLKSYAFNGIVIWENIALRGLGLQGGEKV